MGNIKSTKLRGDFVYNFINTYNKDVACYNRYHKDNVEKLNWNDTVTKLNEISDEQNTRLQATIKKAWKAYYKIIETELNAEIRDILKLNDFKDMW